VQFARAIHHEKIEIDPVEPGVCGFTDAEGVVQPSEPMGLVDDQDIECICVRIEESARSRELRNSVCRSVPVSFAL